MTRFDRLRMRAVTLNVFLTEFNEATGSLDSAIVMEGTPRWEFHWYMRANSAQIFYISLVFEDNFSLNSE